MNVLFVMSDALLYGSSKSMLDLAIFLSNNNVCVKFLLPSHGPLAEELKKSKVEYKIYKYAGWVNPIGCKMDKIKFPLKWLYNQVRLFHIGKWIKENDFQIIHSANSTVYFGALIARKFNIKHVWHLREFLEEDYGIEFSGKRYARRLLREADELICISKVVYEKFYSMVNCQMNLVYNGVKKGHYDSDRFKANKISIVMIGSLIETKGQGQAIEAAKLLVDKGYEIELNIIGDGPDEVKLKQRVEVAHLTGTVLFHGFSNDVCNFRKKADIALVCSHQEAFGRVTAEAMMAGNLVIGANSGGTAELVTDEKTGLLYTPGRYKDLAEKIEWAINHPKLSRTIIENARKEAVSKFEYERYAKDVLHIYRKLIG